MRPVSGRIGTTNGGKAADDFAFGTRLRPTIGNDTDEDCQGARVRTRHSAGKKRFGIRIIWANFKRSHERVQWYATKRQRDDALRGINLKNDFVGSKASLIDR